MMLLCARAYRVILKAISGRENAKTSANGHYGSGRQARRECLEALESRTLLDAVSFDPPRTFDVGAGPIALCMGDFNGDGKTDIASANGNTNTISVLLGNGDGTFQTRTDYVVGSTPGSLAVSDFNGDSKSDIAVAVPGNNAISIFPGNGDGTFQTRRDIGIVDPGAICAGDLNGDGNSDLAATGGDDRVRVLLGNGDGTFVAAGANDVGSGPEGLAVGDFNGDGISDLVSANYVTGSSVSVLLGNGDGTYQAANNYVGVYPLSVATGDFNNDEMCDIAMANASDSTVGILLSNGDGTFDVTGNFGVDPYIASLAVGYFNNDEYSDIVTASYISNTVNILLGNGDGTFGSKIAYGVGSMPRAVMVGDFNGDGLPDIAAANAWSNNVSILLNAGNFAVHGSFSHLSASTAMIYGTPAITLSGILKANGTPIPDGETVTVTINGVAQTTTTAGGMGHFSLDFPTSGIPASTTPYTIDYSYAGDAKFAGTSDSSRTVAVNAAPLTVIANPQSKTYGQVNPALTGTLSGVLNGDGITVGYSTTATQFSDAGSYPITAILSDPNNKLGNYTVSNAGSTLTIAKADQTITWAAPASITYGTPLSTAQLNANVTGVADGSAAGALVYIPAAGTILSVGSHTLMVSAAATTDYNAAATSVSIAVGTVTPGFANLSGPASIAYGTSESTLTGTLAAGGTPVPNGETVTITINGVAQTTTTTGGNGGFSLRYPTAAIAVSPTPYPITFAYGGDASFNASTDNTSRTLSVMQATLLPASIFENQPEGTVVGTLGVTGPNGGAPFTYALVSGAGDNASFTIVGGQLLSAASFDYETRSSYSILVRTTDSGGWYFEQAFTVTVTNVNEAPTDVALSAASIAENQPVGAIVGILSSTDPDGGDTHSYALVGGAGGADNASFTISGSTLKTAASFDFEASNSYSIRVRGSDQGGLFCEKVFTISVTNVNETPRDIALSSSSIAENRPVGTAVGTLSTTDPDAGNSFTYSLVSGTGSTDNAWFTISGGTLQTAASFDFEAGNSYSIRVRTTDQGGLYTEKAFIITVSDVNEQPGISSQSFSIAENSGGGTMVGTVVASDVDAGQSLTYSITAGNTGNAFAIDPVTGQIRVAASSILDYEVTPSFSLTVQVTDNGTPVLSKSAAVTVNLINVNETPTSVSLSSTPVAENQTVGTVVGTLGTTDPDAGGTFTYTLVGGSGSADNGLFAIAGNTLRTAVVFDYEAGSSCSIRVRSTDQGSLYTEKVFTITITNVNEAPTEAALSNTAVAENQPVGTVVGMLSSSDPDLGDTFTYVLVAGSGSADNGSFSISGNQLLTASSFDYEGKSSYSIRVRGSDAGGLYVEKAFTISVSNVNETPTDVALSNGSVAENQAAGTIVGTLSSVDPDASNAFTYTLVSGLGSDDNGSVTISGNRLLSAASFNYEGKNSYLIRVRTTDQGGLYTEKAFTVSVTNVNETPTDVVLSNAAVAENQAAGSVVGTLGSFDPDLSDAFTYTLVAGSGSDDNSSFRISGNELLTTAAFDHEAKESYSIRVRGTDAGGLYVEKVFAVGVSDVNEAPTDVALSSTVVQENQVAGTVVGTLSSSDPDTGETSTYALVDGVGGEDNDAFAISGGRLTTVRRLDYEARSSYTVRVRATDAGGLSVEKPFTITVTDDADDLRGTLGLVDGKKVTLPALEDGDGDFVTFTLSGTGMAKVYGFDKSFEDIILSGTGPKTALTIKVKKVGDGVVTLGNISSDGLLKSINAPAAMLSGLVQVNTLNQFAGKAVVAMKLRQISDADIQVQGMPISSIVVSGDVSDSRIVTTGSISKFSAATLLDSDILVGVATNCAEHFAAADDFVSVTAKLGSLKVSGRKLPSGSQHPAYVAGSHISAPSVGTVTLLNVSEGSGPLVHVLTDTGTLKVSQSKATSVAMFASGTWKVAGARPVIWEVL